MDIAKHVLVVGGAGFIGSHMVLALQQAGYQPIVLDNLSKGHRNAVINAPLIVGDMADSKLLHELFTTYSFAAVMHFASFIEVAESVQFPDKYYQNNVVATLTLMDVMLQHHIQNFIFSSSAAVYGNPNTSLITESHPLKPINPYGRSKLLVENVLEELSHSMNLHYAALRYFNAAGSDPLGRIGEWHEPESHLIPNVLRAAERQTEIVVHGNHYSTPDGTCVRDYIHVLDLCEAHLLAMQALFAGKKKLVCNLGTGTGHSVLEVIAAARRVTGRHIATRIGAARLGDPAILVADSRFAQQELNWQPRYSHLDNILEHAWKFLCDKATLIC